MNNSHQLQDSKKLLRDGWSDEDVERLTGLDPTGILLLRVEAAAAPPLTRCQPQCYRADWR